MVYAELCIVFVDDVVLFSHGGNDDDHTFISPRMGLIRILVLSSTLFFYIMYH